MTRPAASAAPAPLWATHREVLAHLRLEPRTIRVLMAATIEAGIAPPWADVGLGRRPCYRWRLDLVDDWLVEVTRWRTSRAADGDGPSGGVIPMDGSESSPARPSTRRAPTSSLPTRRSAAADTTSLAKLAKDLTST